MTNRRQNTWNISRVLQATNARWIQGPRDAAVEGFSTDSRTLRPNMLFIAIVGETHDGHDFTEAAVKNGACGLLVNAGRAGGFIRSGPPPEDFTVMEVPDTHRALGALAADHRLQSDVSVAAVTGSNGKTTTREMLAGILRRRYSVLTPRKNFNNAVGVPLTLLRLTAAHQWAVMELGMNRFGEIAYLTRLCRPDIGMITNVGPAHLEGVGSLEGVLTAKGELPAEMETSSTVVLNGDDPFVSRLAEKVRQRVVRFGFTETNDIFAQTDPLRSAGAGCFTLHLPGGSEKITLKAGGRHMIENAAAAAAAAAAAGMSGEEIRAGLESFQPLGGRFQMYPRKDGVWIIDDTYNANPASVQAALQVLAERTRMGRTFFVMGDMRELGENTEALHREIGKSAAASGISFLCTTGEFADHTATGARNAGMRTDRIYTGSKDALIAGPLARLHPGDTILIKGSRAAKMEEIVEAISVRGQEKISSREERV